MSMFQNLHFTSYLLAKVWILSSKTGIIQEYKLSPCLFNIVLEELKENMQQRKKWKEEGSEERREERKKLTAFL